VKRISIIRRVLGGAQGGRPEGERSVVHSECQPADVGRNSAHFCGGCGAGFLVDAFLAVFPVDVGGTEREFCACCLEFLGGRLPATDLACTQGYDAEGQALNARFPQLTPTEKRSHRVPQTQFLLETVFRASAARLGVTRPDPLFLSS
jgi:hypothetical protein